jgi:hypothetical protein
MNEECFTPGPWKIRMSGSVGTDRMMVASVYPMETEAPGENAANARLIAAAPELLEFIQEFVQAWDEGMAGDTALYRAAERLIAKATGIARALPQGAPE